MTIKHLHIALPQCVLALAAMVFCCQCQNSDSRSVTSLDAGSKFGKFGKLATSGYKREGGYQFEDDYKSKKKRKESGAESRTKQPGEKAVRNSKGEVVRWEKKESLYASRTDPTNSKAEFGKSEFRFDGKKSANINKSFKTSNFKTPEYIKRQSFSGHKSFDGISEARESGQQTKGLRKLFTADSATSSSHGSARENGSKFRGADESFSTKSYRKARKAQENQAVATGIQSSEYTNNTNLTIDDVRKLASPNSIRKPSS